MPRAIARLMPDRMTDRALWARSYSLTQSLRWESGYSVKERDKLVDQLLEVLDELHLRGTQLQLPTPTDPAA